LGEKQDYHFTEGSATTTEGKRKGQSKMGLRPMLVKSGVGGARN